MPPLWSRKCCSALRNKPVVAATTRNASQIRQGTFLFIAAKRRAGARSVLIASEPRLYFTRTGIQFARKRCRLWFFAKRSGGLMRITLALAPLLVLVATASSQAEDNRACILKATEALPHIAGLAVTKTRTRPVPAEIMATWRGQTRPIMVDVDMGAAETYSYICALTNKTAFVRRVMS